jgi:hypothetical protein
MIVRYPTRVLLTTTIAALTAPISGLAIEGKTADGCTYKVINGQYLTQCPTKGNDNTTYVAPKTSDTVTNYSAVPMRSNSAAPIPSVQTAPAPVLNVAIETPSQQKQISESYETTRKMERDQREDSTYFGILVGSSSIKNSSGAFGLSGSLGTSIDDHFGVELGYSYSGQSLNLGLASRSGNDGNGGQGEDPLAPASSKDDVSFRSHLFSGEIQGHLTNTMKRLRPYLGLGFGYRLNSLNEKSSTDYYSGTTISGGSLSQNSFGGLASAGAKLRISKTIQLGLMFRYFFPLASQEPKIENGGSNLLGNNNTRLRSEDSLLTEGSQTQIQGGIQVNF